MLRAMRTFGNVSVDESPHRPKRQRMRLFERGKAPARIDELRDINPIGADGAAWTAHPSLHLLQESPSRTRNTPGTHLWLGARVTDACESRPRSGRAFR